MDLFEKVTWGLTGIVVVGVIALIVVTSVVGVELSPSTISEDEVRWEFRRANRHLFQWSSVSRPDVVGRGPQFGPGALAAAVPGGARGARPGAGRPGQPGGNDGVGVGVERGPRADGGGDIALGPTDAGSGGGGSWSGGFTQDPATGAYEAPTVRLPALLVEHYRHADQARAALNSAESYDIDYGGQTAVKLGNVPANSPLAEYLGLQQGDIVVAVNGYAVSRSNGMNLYQRLKNEEKFRVEIDRGGTRIIAKYEVERN
jgi:hypothetical protein